MAFVAPYLINIRRLSHEDAVGIIRNWLDKCVKLKPLVGVNDRIMVDLNAAAKIGYLPIAFSDLKTENRELANIVSRPRIIYSIRKISRDRYLLHFSHHCC